MHVYSCLLHQGLKLTCLGQEIGVSANHGFTAAENYSKIAQHTFHHHCSRIDSKFSSCTRFVMKRS